MPFYSVGPVGFEPVTAVTATPSVEVGTQRVEGANHYIYVYNDCNSSIPTAVGAVLQSGVSNMSVTLSSVTSADFLVGVAVNTMTTGQYGWLVTKGITSVMTLASSGSVAARGMIELGANGKFAPASNTTANGPVVGQMLAAVSSGGTAAAFISVY